MFIVLTEKEVVITKQDYQSFREIQNDFFDLVTSLGPWTPEEVVDYLETEYPDISLSLKEQVDELQKSEHIEIALRFKT